MFVVYVIIKLVGREDEKIHVFRILLLLCHSNKQFAVSKSKREIWPPARVIFETHTLFENYGMICRYENVLKSSFANGDAVYLNVKIGNESKTGILISVREYNAMKM